MAFHDTNTGSDNHGPFVAVFSNSSARTADAGPYQPHQSAAGGDNPVLALQSDDLSVWYLADDSPVTWTFLSGGSGSPSVDSFEGRTGAVVSQAGDYAASEISFAPVGDIAATQVQAALLELDTEKVSKVTPSVDNAIVRFDGVSGDLQSSGVVITNGDVIQNVTDPVSPQDAATKAYVDSQAHSDGDVVGPASATDNAVARYDATTGKLIQDSGVTIDDSDRIFIPVGGAVFVGAAVDLNRIGLFADDTGRDFCVRQVGASGSAFLRLEKANGTLAAPTALLSGEKVGGISGAAHDGTDFNDSAQISFFATEDQSPAAMGSEIQFQTTPDGTALAATQATLEQDGSWDFAANILGNVADPILDQDAATKAYVDSRPQKYHFRFSGRAYMYTDNRWVTPMDDTLGTSYYQFNENAGTGADPTDEWEHQGMPMLPGSKIAKVHIMARTNSTEVTDVEFAFWKIDSSSTERWKTTGVDDDAEVVATEIYRGLFDTPTDFGSGIPQGVAHTGDTDDRHFRTWDFSGLSGAEFTELGEFRIYLRPVGALTTTRYFFPSIIIEYEDI